MMFSGWIGTAVIDRDLCSRVLSIGCNSSSMGPSFVNDEPHPMNDDYT